MFTLIGAISSPVLAAGYEDAWSGLFDGLSIDYPPQPTLWPPDPFVLAGVYDDDWFTGGGINPPEPALWPPDPLVLAAVFDDDWLGGRIDLPPEPNEFPAQPVV